MHASIRAESLIAPPFVTSAPASAITPVQSHGEEQQTSHTIELNGRVAAVLTERHVRMQIDGEDTVVVVFEPHCMQRRGIAFQLAERMAERMLTLRAAGVRWVATRTTGTPERSWARTIIPTAVFGLSKADEQRRSDLLAHLQRTELEDGVSFQVGRLTFASALGCWFKAGDVPSLTHAPTGSGHPPPDASAVDSPSWLPAVAGSSVFPFYY